MFSSYFLFFSMLIWVAFLPVEYILIKKFCKKRLGVVYPLVALVTLIIIFIVQGSLKPSTSPNKEVYKRKPVPEFKQSDATIQDRLLVPDEDYNKRREEIISKGLPFIEE